MFDQSKSSSTQTAKPYLSAEANAAAAKLAETLHNAITEAAENGVPNAVLLGLLEGQRMRVDLAVTNQSMAALNSQK